VDIVILPDVDAVARRAAETIANLASAAIAKRGRFTFAVSGGSTPWLMLEHLTRIEVQWDKVHVLQVDERVAPWGDSSRNWTHVNQALLSRVPIPGCQAHAIPVEMTDVGEAARTYAQTLRRVAGSPAVLDLVHLGLGPDGHTASLVPNDPVLRVRDTEVAVTLVYNGQRRVTLTFPAINQARNVLWVAVGADKKDALAKLLHGDRSIPAGRVRGSHAMIMTEMACIEPPSRR
jgi:6-phosphogluconolactonase